MVFVVFFVLVWVSVEFFNKLDPVPRLEQHFSLHNEERLE